MIIVMYKCLLKIIIQLNITKEKKSMKLPFTIYADLECLLEKMSTCQNNPNESSTTKINKHTPSGYSLFTHCPFDNSKNSSIIIEGRLYEEILQRFKNTSY